MKIITCLLLMLASLLPINIVAQNKATLSGRVKDQYGIPISQATIAWKIQRQAPTRMIMENIHCILLPESIQLLHHFDMPKIVENNK